MARSAGSRSSRKRRPAWAALDDAALLKLRFCDLKLRLQDAPDLVRRFDRLYGELADKGLRFKPHGWLSTEWFSPDGVPGIAVPFYLAHRRLMRLEEKRMLQAEGAGESSCMRILRHEAGHAICSAYRLHRRKRWREAFGRFSDPYPEVYTPRPASRHFVTHLPAWYAQAHPAEDFAETFAVWLAPSSRWRSQYDGWPAMRKLEAVDAMMQQIAGESAPVQTRRRPELLSQLRTTLGEHYRQRRMHYADEFPDVYDNDLYRLFSDDPAHASRPTAAGFLRRIRPELREAVAEWTGSHRYTIDQVLRDMIDRCKELKLRLRTSEREAKQGAMLMVAVQTTVHMTGNSRPVAV